MYEDGNGVDPDFEKAIHWYTEAAKQGLTPSQLSLINIANEGNLDSI